MNRTQMGFIALATALLALAPVSARATTVKPGYIQEDNPVMENIAVNGVRQGGGYMRKVLNVPTNYGQLISVTPGGEGTIFWFQSDRGEIRNVTFDNSAPLIIRRSGTTN